jgi:uncharacterized membrane protein YkvA (DUF1232 family)
MNAWLERAKDWARSIRRDVLALWYAARDSRVPWYAKAVAAFAVAYALSPIDLIPDFVPILGYADDLVIVPLAIMLAVKLIPATLMEEFRERASALPSQPRSYAGALLVALIWIAVTVAIAVWLWPSMRTFWSVGTVTE